MDSALAPELSRKRLAGDVINPNVTTLAPFQTITRSALIPAEFTIVGGEVTPTLKVTRYVVEERWRTIIEKLYDGDGPPVGVAT